MLPERSLEELALALSDPEWEVRYAALRALRPYNYEQAALLLLKALADEDESIRQNAVEALAKYNDVRIVEPLIAMLNDQTSLVRKQAAEKLGELGDVRAIEPLLVYLSNHYLSTPALVALTLFPAPLVMQAFGKVFANPTVKQVRGIVTFARGPWDDERLVPLLILALSDEDEHVRLRAAEQLARRKDVQAVVPLLAMLSDEHIAVRCQAMKTLGLLADERAIAPLIAQLVEKDEQIRIASIRALAAFECREVAQAFTQVLADDPAVQVRVTLVSALKQWSEDAVPLLLRALSDQDSTVRCGAICALGERGDERAVDSLIMALADDTTRSAAIEALGQLGDKRAIDPLLRQLFERNADIRIYILAAVSLASFHQPEVAQAFIRVVEDSTLKSLRGSVAFALGQWDDERAVPLLLSLLVDENWQVRWRAAEALAKHSDKRAVEPLLATLRDEKILVRCRAIDALGNSGDERAIDPLLRQFADKERQIRIAATAALRSFHRPEIVQAFLKALTDDPVREVRTQVASAFAQWRETQAIQPLLAALKATRHNLYDCIRLMQALAEISDDRPLLEILQALANHQGDEDDYIALPDGRMMRWNRVVRNTIDQLIDRIEAA